MKLGKRISRLREDRNLTQSELARILGITRAALSHYENDRRQPTYDTLIKLTQFFSVSIDYVMDMENETRQFHDQPSKAK
ncbi:helix-turn-helix domain-containing protein [Paenibacillus piri]|uniref:XRE family transcriptional regulator n=1 Tax=Paenibacillus piri TaxID=2547395 RepID=A0A4R5KYG9_9BACL|nr:helix-turn-helix transcriptional regulator [Paenibacillus piri]TDG00289.1 XRE family transcriptional regulator [Paenibacillus piri]